jgi:crotonobetainyl-CoA:carnitine CoA-transferase CaiB-like acyl-CoA transferase
MLDVLVGSLANQAQNYLLTDKVPRCAGNDHPNIVPQRVFTTRDGQLVLVVGNDGQFRALCAALGDPALARDPRFTTNRERVRNRIALDARLDPLIATWSTADLTAALDAAGVPSGPINNMQQVFADPQVRARGMQMQMRHPTCDSVPLVANPIRLTGTPITYTIPSTPEEFRRFMAAETEKFAQLIRTAGIRLE